MNRQLVPHPGMACCDPTQDLAGWVTRETARIERMNRWTRVLHQRGRRLRAAATKALVTGSHEDARDLDAKSLAAHGTANAIAQRALIRRGHLERVVDAHPHRIRQATEDTQMSIVDYLPGMAA